MHTFTFENHLYFNKTYKPNFNVPPDLAKHFLKFLTNRQLTSVLAEKISSSNFFACKVTFVRCYAGKVVRLDLQKFFFKTN